MWLHWVDRHSGPAVRHAPDYFARRADGTAAVIVVRPGPITGSDAGDATVFATTAQICAEVGWGYERVGELSRIEVNELHPWSLAAGQGS